MIVQCFQIPQIDKALTKNLLQNVSGVVEPGDMMIVLGRPGAGCSTLLKALSNQLAASVNLLRHISSILCQHARHCISWRLGPVQWTFRALVGPETRSISLARPYRFYIHS